VTVTSVSLTNPGAESGTTGWTVYSGSGTLVSSTTDPHSGTHDFEISGAFKSDTKFAQQITVDPGIEAAIDAGLAAVRGSCWFSTNQDGGQFYIEFYQSDGTTLTGSDYTTTQQNSSLEKKESYVRIPANTRKVRIGGYSLRLSGSIFNVRWDDFELDISNNAEGDWPGVFAPLTHQLGAYVWGTFPTTQLRSSQAAAYTWAASETSTGLYKVNAHQLGAYVWCRSRPRRRRMQAWTFSLDGHDFYVLNLADEWTLCLDTATGQWSEWRTAGRTTWRARIGQNWLGIGHVTADRLYGTNVVVGDDTGGTLWVLDPTQGFDDGVTVDDDDAPFIRYVTGLIPMRIREAKSCAGVYINLALGAPTVSGASVQLRTSDDGGNTFYDHGSVVITPADYTQEVAWRGLGLIRAPGRVFELTDSGASVRINSAEMT